MADNELLPVWVIEPAARADDPAWQGRHIWTRILVREESDAFARLAAEKWIREHAAGKLAADARTGLTDVKLYRTSRLKSQDEAMLEYAGVVRGVLEARDN